MCLNNVITNIASSGTGTFDAIIYNAGDAGRVERNFTDQPTITGSGGSQTNISPSQYVSTTLGSEDYHLLQSSILIHTGLNLTNVFTGVDFTDLGITKQDIDEQDRPDPVRQVPYDYYEPKWDAGADQNQYNLDSNGKIIINQNNVPPNRST